MDDGFPAPGWYHPPTTPDELRYWDGERWTDSTRSSADPAPATATPPAAPPGRYVPGDAYATPPAAATPAGAFAPAVAPASGYGMPTGPGYPKPSPSGIDRNRLSVTTFGVVAVYLGIAMTAGIVLLGIVPVMMSVRAASRKEPLAPVAIAAAVIVVIAGFAFRAHR